MPSTHGFEPLKIARGEGKRSSRGAGASGACEKTRGDVGMTFKGDSLERYDSIYD